VDNKRILPDVEDAMLLRETVQPPRSSVIIAVFTAQSDQHAGDAF
jgi:hypothetical protein